MRIEKTQKEIVSILKQLTALVDVLSCSQLLSAFERADLETKESIAREMGFKINFSRARMKILKQYVKAINNREKVFRE